MTLWKQLQALGNYKGFMIKGLFVCYLILDRKFATILDSQLYAECTHLDRDFQG